MKRKLFADELAVVDASLETCDWLPEGWFVDSRVRKSGASAGRVDKLNHQSTAMVIPPLYRSMDSSGVSAYSKGSSVSVVLVPVADWALSRLLVLLSIVSWALPPSEPSKEDNEKKFEGNWKLPLTCIGTAMTKMEASLAMMETATSSPQQRSLSTDKIQSLIAARSNTLDWLPDHWLVDYKIRQSGASAGQLDRKNMVLFMVALVRTSEA
ncbi:Methyl-CpG DNA binding [Dillenia turbinata]|uniref:Methyl-CpG DNA binding n=1 Tax=Dillenia turbinata TaxID=194707 RepID=A0AAN8VQ68_9MAGN